MWKKRKMITLKAVILTLSIAELMSCLRLYSDRFAKVLWSSWQDLVHSKIGDSKTKSPISWCLTLSHLPTKYCWNSKSFWNLQQSKWQQKSLFSSLELTSSLFKWKNWTKTMFENRKRFKISRTVFTNFLIKEWIT